jgi:hypothetical protein
VILSSSIGRIPIVAIVAFASIAIVVIIVIIVIVIRRGKLPREPGAGSGERGFIILRFKFFDNHGKGDLLPWIVKLWI